MLSEKQKQAIPMLFEGKSVQSIAAALGVHRCTIWRWKGKKEFQKAYNRQIREFIHQEKIRNGFYDRLNQWYNSERKYRRRYEKALERDDMKAANRAWDLWQKTLSEKPLVWLNTKSTCEESRPADK